MAAIATMLLMVLFITGTLDGLVDIASLEPGGPAGSLTSN
jgi:hypothetical protein